MFYNILKFIQKNGRCLLGQAVIIRIVISKYPRNTREIPTKYPRKRSDKKFTMHNAQCIIKIKIKEMCLPTHLFPY